MEKEKNIKILIIVAVSLLLIVLGGYLFNQGNKKEVVSGDPQSLIEKIKKDNFGDLGLFVKDNLSKEDTGILKELILNNNKNIQEVKKILEDNFNSKDGNMDLAFGMLANAIEKYNADIISFIKEDKKNDFQDYFFDLAAEIESVYIQK